MLTAMGDTPDRIGALRYGADDYVVKPYHPANSVGVTSTPIIKPLLSVTVTVMAPVLTSSPCQRLPDSDALERVVDTHIYNLRKKLESAGQSDVLLNGIRCVIQRYCTVKRSHIQRAISTTVPIASVRMRRQ
jgi:two-component system response regulator AdeR